jgi:hypothetical protein
MLDRKLLRDLWAMRAQAAAIAAVMAAGVTMFVAYFSNFDSLQRARPPITSRRALRTCLPRSSERRLALKRGWRPFRAFTPWPLASLQM